MATPNRSAVYRCIPTHGTLIRIQWLLNNIILEDLNITDVTMLFDSTFGGRLSFTNPSDYNDTIITCRAESESGPAEDTALLLIQGTYFLFLDNNGEPIATFFLGLLNAVRSLTSTTYSTLISLTWEPPFTLDITDVDPDITGYCVDVINSTSSVTLHSECEITETEFTYLMPPERYCYSTTFSLSITPFNIVGRGEVRSLLYREYLLSKIPTCII